MTSTKTLISIEDFANIRPENASYPFQTYKFKTCILCSEDATKVVLYDNGNDIIIQERFCDRHIRGIKK